KLADQVAVAIGKAKYFKELSVLNKIARDIGATDPATLDITKMLGRVKTHAKELLDMTNFYIALYDETKEEYSFPYHDDEKEKVDSVQKEDMRKGLTEYVRTSKETRLIDKETNQKLIKEGIIKLVGEPASIWLGAPLIARGKVLGVIAVQDYFNEKAYDEHDLNVLETIASQIAIAIDNAQLYKDAQNRINDLEIVNNIVQTISTKLNTDDLFQTMVVQIANKLNCSHCTIFLPKKEKGEIKLIPQVSHGKFSEQVKTRIFIPGEGLAGCVFQNGESVIKADARLDSRYAQARQRIDKPRSMLVVPVKVGKRAIGVISADQDEKNWFNDSDRQLVETLAQHAGIAIERAFGLNLLQEVGLQLISSEEEDKILQRIVAGAIELTNTEAGIIYLISDDGKSITKRFPFPSNFDPPTPRMNNENGFTREVIDKGKMIIVPDMSGNTRINPWLLEQGFNSMIILPLKMGKKVVGVLYLNSKETNPFSETECSLLEILASQAAIAIYNSGLFQEAQNQRTQVETLYEAFKEIAAETMNVKSIFDKILEKTVQLFKADSAQILFLDEAKNEIKIVFSYESKKVFNGITLKGVIMKEGEGITWNVFKTGKPIFTGDYHKLPERAKIFDEPKYKELYNSLAIVPLKWKGDVICAIALTSTKYYKFTEKDIQLLEQFSSPAAIAIAIAREISFRQTLLDNSPDAIVAIDTKGMVKEFNKASEKIFGYNKDGVLGKPIIDLWRGTRDTERISDLLQNNVPVRDVETFFINQFDKRIPVLFSGSILFAEDFGDEKEKIGSIGQFEDQRMVSLIGRTRKLFEVIEEINRSEELSQILKTVLYKSIDLLEAESGYIALKQGNIYPILECYNNHKKEAERIGITINEEVVVFINGGIPKAISLLTESGISLSDKGKSGLVLPLKIEDKIIGVLYLESNANDFFREENDLLQILSSGAAIAINRAQLKEESEQLQFLKEIGDKIRVKGEFEKYKDIIVKTSQKLLRAEISSIFLYDKSKRCLSRVAIHPKIEELENLEEFYSSENSFKGITGNVLEFNEGKNDHIIYSDEEEILKKALPMHLEKYNCLSSWKKIRHEFARSPIVHYLVVPIFGEKGKVFGALRVMNKISKEYSEDNPILDEHGFKNPEDVKLLKTIASFLSQALSSERKAEKLRMLHEITDEISSKTDIQG
ncbi:MAG: GAF domain-containing protein, partial [Acidobacteria bacterium]|nr:GAF domain-containing protein [Acidobacteriota bacterium]